MSRTVRYILIIILIAAAAMWVLTVYRSCQTAKKENTESTTNGSTTGDTNSATEDTNNTTSLEDLYEDEEGEEEDSTEISDKTDGSGTTLDKKEESDGDDEVSGGSTTNTSGSEDEGFEDRKGNYLVVAGAFVAKSNADSYQRQLKKKGYDPEVRIFLGSDYHSVILGDYATEGEALSVAKKLGGEAYVHKRRFPKKR